MQELVPTNTNPHSVAPAPLQDPELEAAQHTMTAAQHMFESIAREAMEFQAGLDNKTELGAIMVASGMPKTIHVRQIRFKNPDIIMFSGIDQEGNPVRLLQHYTMVSIAFVSVKVPAGTQPYRIGFLSFDGTGGEATARVLPNGEATEGAPGPGVVG
jgi:hypothetical protein